MGGPPPLATDAAVVERSDLHLHKRDGKLMAFPVIPVYTLTMSGLSVFAVKVGPMTVFVPPGSFVGQCTVGDSNIIVLVLGRERSALVVAQRVT